MRNMVFQDTKMRRPGGIKYSRNIFCEPLIMLLHIPMKPSSDSGKNPPPK
jgi:hypothetical protein